MQHSKKQGGYVLVVVALVITIFLGFVALSVDAGVLYSARASAQRAADAAALAGAFAFVTRPDITSANANDIKQYAISAAAQNRIFGTTVTIATTDVDVDFANRRVTVRVNHPQPTLFARAIGENSANIHATAIAESANSATGDRCPKPWFIPNTVISPQNGPNALCNACAADPQEVIIDMNPASANYRLPSAYYATWLAGNPSRQFTIKPQNPQQAVAPGQFFAIRLGDSQGGQDYETNIATCTTSPIYCAASYPSEPGNMVGPTRQGVYRLIDYNQDQNCNNNCITDTYVGVGRYQRPGPPYSDGQIGSVSRSLVIAPIIDVCVFCPNNFPSGTTSAQYTVIGFATIFIEGFQGNDVVARLINVTDCSVASGGGGGINPQETGPFGLPVRLVRLP